MPTISAAIVIKEAVDFFFCGHDLILSLRIVKFVLFTQNNYKNTYSLVAKRILFLKTSGSALLFCATIYETYNIHCYSFLKTKFQTSPLI